MTENNNETKSLIKERKNRKCRFYIPKRCIVVFLLFWGFAFASISKTLLGIAIVPMTANNTPGTQNLTNTAADLDWDSETQGILLSLNFYGGIVAQVPFGYLCGKYGGKIVFGSGMITAAIINLTAPIIAKWNLYVYMTLRFIQGFAECVIFPANMELLSKWIPPSEITTSVMFATSGMFFGTVLSLQIGGLLAASQARWPSIFYFFGGTGVLWYVLWVILVTEQPEDHPSISNEELKFIKSHIIRSDTDREKGKQKKIPWFSILTSGPVWAISFAFSVMDLNYFLWMAELPTYMDSVYNIKIKKNGLMSSVPYLSFGIFAILGGVFANAVNNRCDISTGTLRKGFFCGAILLQALVIVLSTYAPTPTTFIICITIALGLGGVAEAGPGINPLDIAPEYSGIIVGLSNSLGFIPSLLAIFMIGYFVNEVDQWQILFYIWAGLCVLGALIYGLLASGEKQKWSA